MTLSNQPPKGTSDWFPEELIIRQYIFDVWRRVCRRYGYEEYLTPLVESAEIYRAKSGADVGGKELVTFTDQGGRELSIRPEMTPSVTRMVSQIYDSVSKPIRFFSIANFMRNEKPQRGRNREFWQLNVDLFGSTSLQADTEIATLALDIMLEFNPPAHSFQLGLNHRQIINEVLDLSGVMPGKKQAVARLMDKWEKMGFEDFKSALLDLAVPPNGVDRLAGFLACDSLEYLLSQMPELSDNEGFLATSQLINTLTSLGYGEYIRFQPSVIRGFDYYDGMVFEIFDLHPDNLRALFGGGRYNGLSGIFGKQAFPAVGFAPGDETLRLFLESWEMLENIRVTSRPNISFLPLLSEDLTSEVWQLAKHLRAKGLAVELGLEVVRLGKALEYANKKNCQQLIVLGEEEFKNDIYKIKDMVSGQENEVELL
ncbi:histidine--tRNA ligase [Candidatus Falkowbacteria bacterium CG10_big_fil_rev_8_21_14_0_10_37_14]|uniref:Histidine--tRNA ligase n=1 Tax=Candidatus Falkowbacteria bacterium CG10_big_fil_rev_8_21_14_0_10_37_14 TaxID=1974561 RepID=A0A2M6WUB5_9BACT|nr:histidine--tRNA ligase [Candidatus Falkowbacteria bacterium]PIT96393.1 MAG: histidine--tRNA ligase [Candidatus Falkowbacteria bacterium CG10_big_fil_rev_8_21_14_0_10_37_14]